MSLHTDQSQDIQPDDEQAIRALYERLLSSRNSRKGDAYAADFTDDASAIGFDGSEMVGRAEIAAITGQIVYCKAETAV